MLLGHSLATVCLPPGWVSDLRFFLAKMPTVMGPQEKRCEECTDEALATHACVQCDMLLCEVLFPFPAGKRCRRRILRIMVHDGTRKGRPECLPEIVLEQECVKQHKKSKRTSTHETR